MVAIQMESKGEIDPTYITFFWLWPTEPLKGKLIVYPYVTLQWFYAFGGVSYLMAFDGICVSVMMGLAGQRYRCYMKCLDELWTLMSRNNRREI
ncbi:hypothetical protein JYU34_006429 [Plutella xylostella]|uniref:Odorant receptor n=1 Tax=Plutella xylostella TaxID=51655 RepID=A0ABQ7QS05_PLUXY|nr:hypothetical protein JYU34_006429 [Plutella xylostella]